jgi:hypothetical protein
LFFFKGGGWCPEIDRQTAGKIKNYPTAGALFVTRNETIYPRVRMQKIISVPIWRKMLEFILLPGPGKIRFTPPFCPENVTV